MNTTLILLSLLELGIALLLSVFVLYLTFLVMQRLIVRRYDIEKDNIAFAVLGAAMLFSVGNILEGIVAPVSSTIRQLRDVHDHVATIAGQAFLYILLFFVISFFIALLINWLSIQLYISLTHFDEFEEIRQNNIAIGILTGVIMIVISMFVKEAIIQVMESLVPYPRLPNIR
ncbi:MAG: DUF350 domain-containing protein [Bernardetiaceae bacterium]